MESTYKHTCFSEISVQKQIVPQRAAEGVGPYGNLDIITK